MEPSFREPMLATLVDDPQLGADWWFERKLDGIRLIAVRDGLILSDERQLSALHQALQPAATSVMVAS